MHVPAFFLGNSWVHSTRSMLILTTLCATAPTIMCVWMRSQ